jgi:adenosyl cobinamide kinase/adenosyl cobinamide phosphate guanylyltransferase/NaMN:DMB phosphoribosyltransferase
MASFAWRRALIVGGIRSGKSELAEELVAGSEPVVYVATARVHSGDAPDADDPQWAARIAAHRERRPEAWTTVEVGENPLGLIGVLNRATADQSILVEDLGTWIAAVMEPWDPSAPVAVEAATPDESDPADEPTEAERVGAEAVDTLVLALSTCPARVVLVSPEVGLSVVPATATGREFADAVGATNRAVARVCDSVALVVAGQAAWLKGGPGLGSPARSVLAPGERSEEPAARAAALAVVTPDAAAAIGTDSAPRPTADEIKPGMSLPVLDEAAGVAARERLNSVNLGVAAPTGKALGVLTDLVAFAAAAQSTVYPRPFLATRVVHFAGAHEGAIASGPNADPHLTTPLPHLANAAGASIVTLEWQPAAAAIESGDAITLEQVEAALRGGWAEAERAADEGIELLVVAAGGAGAATAAAAVIAAVTGAEPAAILPRVVTPDGRYDDAAWMARCIALREALHRVRDRDGDPRTVLAALGGADIAAATGLILGGASRRTPVLIDGPVGAAAALIARDFSAPARDWVLLPDHGGDPAVEIAGRSLGLRTWLDLRLDLGEGAGALASLPLLQMALTFAGVGEPAESTQDLPPLVARATAAVSGALTDPATMHVLTEAEIATLAVTLPTQLMPILRPKSISLDDEVEPEVPRSEVDYGLSDVDPELSTVDTTIVEPDEEDQDEDPDEDEDDDFDEDAHEDAGHEDAEHEDAEHENEPANGAGGDPAGDEATVGAHVDDGGDEEDDEDADDEAGDAEDEPEADVREDGEPVGATGRAKLRKQR